MQPFIKKIQNADADDWRKYGIFVYGKNQRLYILSWNSCYEEARHTFRRDLGLTKPRMIYRNKNEQFPNFKYTNTYGLIFNIIGERKSNAKTTSRNKIHGVNPDVG